MALSRLFSQIEVDVVTESMVGLMNPANRMEAWEGEEGEGEGEEGRPEEMSVTEKVVPYDLLNSEEAFYWSCVCRLALAPEALHIQHMMYTVCACGVCVCVCMCCGVCVCVYVCVRVHMHAPVSGTYTTWETWETSTWTSWFRPYQSSVSTYSGELYRHSHMMHTIHRVCHSMNYHQLCGAGTAAGGRCGGEDAETVCLPAASLHLLSHGSL